MKPWTLMTTIPAIVISFSTKLCDGLHAHGTTISDNATRSSNYTDELARIAHDSFATRINLADHADDAEHRRRANIAYHFKPLLASGRGAVCRHSSCK